MLYSVGEILEGRYRIEAMLGRGGFGFVLKCTDLDLDCLVAIKISLEVTDYSLRKAVIKEARTMQKLSQLTFAVPRVTQVIQTSDNRIAIVMEFATQGSLRSLLQKSGAFTLVETVTILWHVAEVLTLAHRKKILHRDVKPENILLSEGRILLSDFGISGMSDIEGDTIDRENAKMGTLHYLCPEFFLGRKESTARDIYALGCVAFEMLTGRTPFVGNSIEQQHIDSPIPITLLPVSLQPVFAKVLAKNPLERYRTAEEFVLALNVEQGQIVLPAPSLPHILAGVIPHTFRRLIKDRSATTDLFPIPETTVEQEEPSFRKEERIPTVHPSPPRGRSLVLLASGKDKEYRNDCRQHLEAAHHRIIYDPVVGASIQAELLTALLSAEVIVLLLSVDFLTEFRFYDNNESQVLKTFRDQITEEIWKKVILVKIRPVNLYRNEDFYPYIPYVYLPEDVTVSQVADKDLFWSSFADFIRMPIEMWPNR